MTSRYLGPNITKKTSNSALGNQKSEINQAGSQNRQPDSGPSPMKPDSEMRGLDSDSDGLSRSKKRRV